MKSKLLTIFLVALIVFSTLSLISAKTQCPKCKGTGTIVCPNCHGTGEATVENYGDCEHCSATGVLTPSILCTGKDAEQREQATFITGKFKNQETIEAHGIITATISERSGSSQKVSFPPGEEVSVTIRVDFYGGYTRIQLLNYATIAVTEVDEVTCPYCDGTGVASQTTRTCPECYGTGEIECPTCDGTGFVDNASNLEEQDASGIPLAAIAAGVGVAVIAGAGATTFFLMKSRRVNEKSLRRFSSREFNDWVLAKLNGKAPTARDTAMGIDGYTSGGEPVLIKQTDGVGMNVIDSFAAALARNRARGGTIVAFSFGDDAVRGKVRAKMNYRLEIEMLTVTELLDGNRRF